MDWPSKRVSQGGLFHPPKVQYSKETHELIKLLMEESKLTMMHRNNINYHLRNGKPLPLPVEKKIDPFKEHLLELQKIRSKRIGRRKTLDSIKASGAYEFPKYYPKPNLRTPIEKDKIRLQEEMSGLTITPSLEKFKPFRKADSKKVKEWTPTEKINLLLDEIKERTDWLEDMEQIGEGKKHRDVIKLQIAERLREIKHLEVEEDKDTDGLN